MNETLLFCPHGCPVKFNCMICGMEGICVHGINPQFRSCHECAVAAMNELVTKLEERFSKLEEHHVRQIDENRKISKRIDEIEKRMDEVFGIFKVLIINLEKNNIILEKEIYHPSISEMINETEEALLKARKPHKCPVCYGYGQWELESLEEAIANDGSKIRKCHSCEGTGIIWG